MGSMPQNDGYGYGTPTMMINSNTRYELANDARGEHVMLYGSNIDAVLAEISHRRFRPAELLLVVLCLNLVVCCR